MNLQQILTDKNQNLKWVVRKDNVAKCLQWIQNFYADPMERFDGILFLLKMVTENQEGNNDYEECTDIVQFLIAISGEYPKQTQDRFLKWINESEVIKADTIIFLICMSEDKDPVLCDMLREYLFNDQIKIPYDKGASALILMKWYLSSTEDPDQIYEKFMDLDDQCLSAYLAYLLNKGRYQKIIDLSKKMKMNKKSDYETLIISYHHVGNQDQKKKVMLEFFAEFPKKELLNELLNVLDEKEIDLYHIKIMNSARRSREVLKEASMRIGNADDLFFLLRKGNLSLADRIEILSHHTVELYKKDKEGTLLMLKKDLMKILRSCNISVPLLQDLVFALSKLKKGREILEDVIKQLAEDATKGTVKEMIQSVMEENCYVYSEGYEA